MPATASASSATGACAGAPRPLLRALAAWDVTDVTIADLA